jgi:cytochrome c6
MKTPLIKLVKPKTLAPLYLFFTLAAASVNQLAAAPLSGADLFKSKCAMCHGQDGSGDTPMGQKLKTRDLRSAEVQKQTDAEFTTIITNGKPPMPAYGKTLAPADIKQLVTYLRNMQPKG